MLDSNIIEQLKSVYGALDNEIQLTVSASEHADQAQLLEMLRDVAHTSSKITVEVSEEDKSGVPFFRLLKNKTPTGISFKGIPSGHEFTSLILAILNADGKGKLPDSGILDRIKKLKGPIELRTYVSLSCENCPDVVQALNLMALVHDNFTHQMIDGAYVQDEVKALGIQGVPSVMSGDKLVHSGKISLLDLISKLEKFYGAEAAGPVEPHDLGKYDVVVVGGGPAGASAAIYAVRKGLKTALIAEKIGGQVQDTKGIENLISVPYTEGPKLSAQLAAHVAEYPVEVLEHRRVKSVGKGEVKHIELESGETLDTRALIVATGAKWRELGIPGEKEYIGRGVAYCPHCDGPYYKGKKVAVIGGGNSGVEAAIDLAGIVREVVVFEFMENLKADQVLVDKLKSLPNVSTVTNARTAEVVGDGGKVVALNYEERATGEMKKVDLDGVFVQIGLLPNSGFIEDVVETTKFGEIVVDVKNRTSEPGIYAAGDVTTVPYKQIIISMGEGAKSALAAFEDLMLK